MQVKRHDAFAIRLRNLRIQRGFSERDLARLTGVSKVALWQWEAGTRFPRAANLRALARELDVSESFLLHGPDQVVAPAETPALSSLADAILYSKKIIGHAAGVSESKVKILIDYPPQGSPPTGPSALTD